MHWFEEQLNTRKRRDDEGVHDANIYLSSIVMGQEMLRFRRSSNEEGLSRAQEDIVNYYKVGNLHDLITRRITLKDKWYKKGFGAFLALDKDDDEVALLPGKWGHYYYRDKVTQKMVRVTKKTELNPNAISFYRTLPRRALTIRDLLLFSTKEITKTEVISFLFYSLLVVLIGMMLPYINVLLFDKVLKTNSTVLLAGVGVMYLFTLLSGMLISTSKALVSARLHIKVNTTLTPALYMRLLSLPVTFYKRFTSGELAERSSYIGEIVELFFGSILTAVIGFSLSFVYLFQLSVIAPQFVMPTTGVILFTLLFSALNTFISARVLGKTKMASAKLSGMLLGLINGIQKIKLTGSEKRAYAQWAEKYKEKAQYEYNPPLIMKVSGAVSEGVTLLSTLIFYIVGAKHLVTPAEFMAFTVAFGLMNGAALSLSGVVSSVAQIFPLMDLAKPILNEVPEHYTEKKELEYMDGTIAINHVDFRYSDKSPYIFQDLSLKISSGEYVGIVGKTGCGKSTLVRLLLGFEKPLKGAIYYNQIDINDVNLQSLRRKIGVVLQTSKLFTGSILSNLAITNPQLTEEKAWELMEMVGLKQDIEEMPMGIYTHVTEGGGGLSGGQMQRILIARALASEPSLLIFDEATSALDNITQRVVIDSLDSLKCTKIVIAHRLSTIRNCDRILVLDKGEVVETGTYDELMAQQGYFSELVKRQL